MRRHQRHPRDGGIGERDVVCVVRTPLSSMAGNEYIRAIEDLPTTRGIHGGRAQRRRLLHL